MITQSCIVNGKEDVEVISQAVDYQNKGVLVRITRGGICGSDLHYYQHGKVGDFAIKMPMVLGHEVIGEVLKSDNPQLAIGQKVAINPSKPCQHCKYCLAQEHNQCTAMRFFGSAMYSPHVDGGFTQYKIVDAEQCIPFDNRLDEKIMVFAEPLAVCIHAINQAGEVRGKKVFVSGVGPIGCLIVAAARASGAETIVCSDISERSRNLALLMGADQALEAASGDFSPYLQDKGYFDQSFEASGSPQALIRCLEVTRAKGKIVQVGMGGDIPQFPIMKLIAKEIDLVGTFRFTTEFVTAVQWLADGIIDPLPLLSGEYDYQEIDNALRFAGDKQQAAKVQLIF